MHELFAHIAENQYLCSRKMQIAKQNFDTNNKQSLFIYFKILHFMKKFFYVALMALSVAIMTGCSGSIVANNPYKAGDPQPSIDPNAGTVNGKSYDNTTEKCWVEVISSTAYGYTEKEETYMWATEFEMEASYQMFLWEMAQAGGYVAGVSASCSYSAAPQYKDYESCIANNEDY